MFEHIRPEYTKKIHPIASKRIYLNAGYQGLFRGKLWCPSYTSPLHVTMRAKGWKDLSSRSAWTRCVASSAVFHPVSSAPWQHRESLVVLAPSGTHGWLLCGVSREIMISRGYWKWMHFQHAFVVVRGVKFTVRDTSKFWSCIISPHAVLPCGFTPYYSASCAFLVSETLVT
jgi:hypothetical protein